ncbi:MAG: hypothetical protein M0Z71_07090 [Nitrospiraceae bacterium]|nr:hypothetical protein [Nitrospiraceae bacterium]
MKKLITISFLFSVIVLLLGGCTYYYPLDYDRSYYPDNYGFIAPFNYYSPYGYYSYSPYPYSYPYGYYHYYPSTRFYLGERPEDFRERKFESPERPAGPEKEGPPAK